MGLKQILTYGGGLILATTGPISLFTGSDMVANAKKSWLSQSAATAPASPSATATPPLSTNPTAPSHLAVAAIPGAPSVSGDGALPTLGMEEAFNFDATIDWVMRRWPRVSTGLAKLQLQGYRVPLVTGTASTDLAGSLTYYFNTHQQVEQITFHGTTGDATQLVNLLTSRYQFTRRLTNDPGMILYEAADSANHMTGIAKIRSAGIIKSNQPYNRFDVDLTIDRQR